MDISQKRAELSLRLRRTGLRLGWMGAVGAALVLLAGAEFFSVTLPAADEVADLEAQVLRQRESPRSGREIASGQEAEPGAQITAFERFFPPASDINRLIGEIHTAAKKENLVLERGDYRLAEEQGLNLLRYQITLPVKGGYPSIRGFVRRVLRDMPYLALDGISMQRQAAGEEVLEAQIRLSVFQRGGE